MTTHLFHIVSFSEYKYMWSAAAHLYRLNTNQKFLSSIYVIFKINQEEESWNAESQCLPRLKILMFKSGTW
jgi:hypothetical protein